MEGATPSCLGSSLLAANTRVDFGIRTMSLEHLSSIGMGFVMGKDLAARIQEIQAQAWAPVQAELRETQRKWAAKAVARWEDELKFWSKADVPLPARMLAKYEGELAKAKAALAALD